MSQTRYVLSLFTFFLFMPVSAMAQQPQPTHGLRYYDDVLKDYVAAPGIASEIDVTLNGEVAYTTLTQYFMNDTQNWQEGKYTYPIPEGAAVHALTMMIGDKRVIGFVHEKQKAKQIYAEAKEQGQAAGLVEQHRRNIFQTSVANIPPQSMVAISIEYQTAVEMDDYIYSYRLPMAITPRYDRFHPETMLKLVSSAGQPWAEDVINRVKLSHFEGGANPVHLNVSLNAGFDVTGLQSASHDIEVTRENDLLSISLKDSVIKGEQDFQLSWQPAQRDSDDILVSRYSEAYEGHYYSQVTILPPRELDNIENTSPARHISLVIDTSGSMAGPSIEQAKAALIKAVEGLNTQDLFSITEFNSDYRALFDAPMHATTENKIEAIREISKLEADGGTEYEGALEHVFAETSTKVQAEGYLRQIVFITDGAISYEDKVVKLIDRHARAAEGQNATRLFTVGIGSAPNTYLMNMMAETGRGSTIFISDLEKVEAEMSALFEKMTRPAVTNLALNLPDNKGADILPALMPDLLAGEPVRVLVKSKEPLGRIALSGKKSDQDWSIALDANALDAAKGLHKLYARRKIAALESPVYRGDYQTRDQQIVDLGVSYQVVSSQTSLVAVDEEILRPHYEPLLVKEYDPTLPKGWQSDRMSGLDASRAYDTMMEKKAREDTQNKQNMEMDLPQTASGFMLDLLMGLLLLSAATAVMISTTRKRAVHAK